MVAAVMAEFQLVGFSAAGQSQKLVAEADAENRQRPGGAVILQKLADVGAIDTVLWDHRIIWCQNFIDRLEELYKRRSRSLPIKPSYCNNNCHHKGVIVENEGVIVTNTGVTVTETPQSKVNKSKG